ncbi:MAG: hypothetical protein OEX04_17425 [Acidimicrobiia bacterium]|nr:hypothetical protein [Acidimicrobiia bacterium]MDH4309252.1 hypothetical protein [Acidimicrobiia bacterium]
MTALTPEEADRLRTELAQLEAQQQWITNKETLKQLQYDAAEIKWRLGLMTDEEFTEFEDFYEGFHFEQ